jgi:aminoglycoside phosphotransferase (APT) family kinase protein
MNDALGSDPAALRHSGEASQPPAETAGPRETSETGATTVTEGSGMAAECETVPAGIDDRGVGPWMAEHVPGTVLPLRYELIAGGRSNLTFRVTDAAGRRTVLRRPPTGPLLPTAHDMGREHRIISALAPTGIPVPAALGYCSDPTVTGAPFYVMDHVDGYVLRTEGDADGVFDRESRRAISAHLVDILAELHAIDPDEVGLGDLGRREGYIARQLQRWYAQYRSARDEGSGPDVTDVDAVHDRLVTRIPDQGPAGIVHGDYRLDNTVIRADGSVAAVLDWELCTLGDVLADVAQLLVYWTETGEVAALAHAATAAPGWYTKSEVAERYATSSGRDLGNLDFYLAFAYWKLACILEGVYTRYLAGSMGQDGFDYHAYPGMIADLAGRAREAAERLA